MGKKTREAQDLMNADLLVGQKVLEDKLSETQEWVGRLSEQVAHLTRLPDQIYLDEARGAKVDALGHELSELEAKHHRAIQKLDERVRFLEAAAGAPRQVTGTFTVDI